MIYPEEYDKALRSLGSEYFIHDIHYVPDIALWVKDHGYHLTEPYAPMKLTAKDDSTLSMVVQSELKEETLNQVIKNLGIRRALQDTVTDIEKTLNSTKKRLVFCFLKEYARTLSVLGQDEQVEDGWALDEMKTLGYFDE